MFWWAVKRVLVAIVIVIVLAFATMRLLSRPMPDHPFVSGEDILVIAHRGGRGLWPENTMYAFENSVRMGVDVLEFDIHHTADSVLVVIHDEKVDRTTGGTGAVSEMTLEEIRALDAGYRWSSDEGKTHPYRGRGITIPTLEEVLLAFPDTRLNIELKPEALWVVDRFGKMVEDHSLAENVIVASFHPQIIEAVRSRFPSAATSASTSDALWFWMLNTLYLGASYHPAAHALQVPASINDMEIVTERFIEGAHKHNMDVHVWTINDESEMKQLLRLKVDGIMTDYPDRLLTLLGRRIEAPLPPPPLIVEDADATDTSGDVENDE